MTAKLSFLVFTLRGDYGFFKKPETTSSPLSFYFPSRTMILGIIAAIMGETKDIYHESESYSEENCKLALGINHKIDNIFYNTNTAEFSNSLITNRTPTKYTFLKSPSYTIFVHLKDPTKLSELKNRLIKRDFVYTVSLGPANLFARIEYNDQIEFERIVYHTNESFLQVKTVIPYSDSEEIKIDGEILKTNMPRLMNNKREVVEYRAYLYERNGQPINIKLHPTLEMYNSNKQNIMIM